MASVLALTACLTVASAAQAQQTGVLDRLLRSTGFVVVNKGNGQLTYGTCWVVDHERKLVMTNVHVVGGHNNVSVAFALQDGNGVILTNSAAYTTQDYIAGKVIYRDTKRDLALIQLSALPRSARAIPLAEQSVQPGQKVYSIGNQDMAGKQLDSGLMWRKRTGTVKKDFFWRTKLNSTEQTLEVRVIQTDSGVKPGDSGGPVVNAQGKLVGVVSSTNNEGDYCIDISEVRIVLQRALSKTPAAPNAAVGFWTVTWSNQGKDFYASMTLKADGTAVWVGAKDFPGTFGYKRGKLALDLPGSGISNLSRPTWTNNDQFQFTIQYSDAAITFRAVRR